MAPHKRGILVFAPNDVGGIAEHIHYQIEALIAEGETVHVLTTPSFLDKRNLPYDCIRILMRSNISKSRLVRSLAMLVTSVYNNCLLAFWILRKRPRLVFIDSFVEYFSPFWIWPHILLSKLTKTDYATNLHDPVRDYVVGPEWWHKLSIKLAYIPYSFVLVHQRLEETNPVPHGIRILEVPVGVYNVQNADVSADGLRMQCGARENQKIFLSFGFIRDGKNLDLFIRAMSEKPDVFLMIVGRNQSTKDKPVDYYKSLARDIGVADRVFFDDTFVPDDKIASYFAATDYILLTYNGAFHSQSGVINIAARFRKPVMASSGSSPLKDVVINYRLGVFVEPDSLFAIEEGLEKIITDGESLDSDWDGYFSYASWKTNVRTLLNALDDSKEN